MTQELRPEIVMPTRADKSRFVAVGIGCLLLAAGITLLVVAMSSRSPSRSAVDPAAPAAPMQPASIEELPPPAATEPAVAPATGPRASELAFVFQAGGTSYVKLVDYAAEDALPPHGEPQLFDEIDARRVAVAAMRDGDVPDAQRAWRTRSVVVDGTCTAKVDGFAVVARLTGDPGYAGIAGELWTASNVLAHGTRVLAARLDGCPDGTFARDAALRPVVLFDEIRDDELASAARTRLLNSEPAKQTQAHWIEHGGEGLWHMQSTLTAQVLRHPRTGATWVSVHGHADHECGGPTVNVWGLFRVDATGRLATVQLRQLGDIESIERLIDLEDDGQPELIGRPWLGLDVLATRAGGAELARLGLQFYGCPC